MAKRRALLSSIDQRDVGVCLRCGYDITGVRGEVCPECGKRIELWSLWRSKAFWRIAVVAVACPLLVAAALWALPKSSRGFAVPNSLGFQTFASMAIPSLLWLALVFGASWASLRLLPKGLKRGANTRVTLHFWPRFCLLVAAVSGAAALAVRAWGSPSRLGTRPDYPANSSRTSRGMRTKV